LSSVVDDVELVANLRASELHFDFVRQKKELPNQYVQCRLCNTVHMSLPFTPQSLEVVQRMFDAFKYSLQLMHM
jgi:hypothetical protein